MLLSSPNAFISHTEKTFQYQSSLPPLPIPPLKQTLSKYLNSVQPLVSDSEFLHTKSIVQDFSEGVGQDLQRKLLTKFNHHKCWVEEWWIQKAYLEERNGLAPLGNFTGPGPYCLHYFSHKPGSQAQRAALHTWFMLQYWDLIRKEKLAPEKGSRKVPWCMNQHRRLFTTCRVPGETCDELKSWFKTENEGWTPTHFIILCKGRVFSVPAVDRHNQLIPAPELQAFYEYVIKYCEDKGSGPGVGVLTSEDRTLWCQLRQHLSSMNPMNASSLERIETSIFVICLDDASPRNMNQIAREGLKGNPTNRWFDKSATFQVYQNGTVSCNCDHSAMDAMAVMSLTSFEDLEVINCKGKWQGSLDVRSDLPLPEELQFHLDNTLYKAIDAAKKNYYKLAESVDCFTPVYRGYGKNYLRSRRLHPDTHVQVALQLAYYRMYGRPAPTYETATTRMYWHGRTETVRSCTKEALEFSKAMVDPTATMEVRYELMSAAHWKHNALMKEASEGQGCDRHLLGLSIIAQEEGIPTPELFLDESFTKSGGGATFILSTSFVGYSSVYGAVAPMLSTRGSGGYGVFYSMQSDQISFFMTYWTADRDTNIEELYHHLSCSLNDMKELADYKAPPTASL